MKKILLIVLGVVTGLSTQAQTRYLDEVFTNIKVDSNITYGQNYDYYSNFNSLVQLKMDVYQPDQDTATKRPLMILAHAGSFLPPSQTLYDWATRKQNCIVELAKRYSKKGYVVVSMSYRLGWAFSSSDQETRAKTIINAVYLAMQDMKGCVRYMKENHATYNIDTNKIVLGGTNSGAYVALAAGTLNKPSELLLPTVLDINNIPFISIATSGDFDGLGGTKNYENYPNHSSEFSTILDLGGAVPDTVIIEAGEVPIIAFHGTNETLTPYNTDIVRVSSTGQQVIPVSGAGDLMQAVDRINNNSAFKAGNFIQGPPNKLGNATITQPIEGLYPFYGQAYEPWSWYDSQPPTFNLTATQAKALKYIDTIVGYATPRLYKLLVNSSYVGIEDLNETDIMNSEVYPNPSSNTVFVKVPESAIASIQISDLSGKVVFAKSFGTPTAKIETSEMANGIYLLTGKATNGSIIRSKIAVQH